MYESTARNILMISFFILSVKSTVFQIMENVEMETPKNIMLTSSWLHLDIFAVIRVEIILVELKFYSEIYQNFRILEIFFGRRVRHQK